MKPFSLLLATLLLATGSLMAQDQKSTAPAAAPAQNAHQTAARESYRLDYTITEMDDGKKINARTYSVMCEDEGGPTRGGLKVGSRIPVSTAATASGRTADFTYLDVGINIEARLTTTADGSLSLQSEVEMSSIAEGTQPNQNNPPVIRQLRSSTNNLLSVGKPVTISVADDITSHRQFQIAVLATKLK